ncbi:MAG: hypothetical protein A2945_00085 [Candidatus Liptonbacteria bacterium RIFCSPLOWO2_01_FULL_52_25]|uniref:Uncharacterized protein n=1 Tax=Candidatus Liptonbacteria bacterium RIFCSPLOWO2_01_FULL_52_25 TaxID=1798650 RepID=A0A1G2CFT4_9BACT|nr:MAG: hypothetical protein A2945_00085 [Candidatus Liptonbacteria bacterium RIFCSPLOWO2_01_FULL_52_25]
MELAKDFIKRTNKKFTKELERYNKSKKERHLKWFPDINRRGGYRILRARWTLMKQHNLDEKILIIERFVLKNIKRPVTHSKLKVGNIEYRLGYYMVGKNGNRKNRWTWGESCPIIPRKDFAKLIAKAKKEGTIF